MSGLKESAIRVKEILQKKCIERGGVPIDLSSLSKEEQDSGLRETHCLNDDSFN